MKNAVPIIPDNPNISWATMILAALIVLDVSTEIGEYHSAIRSTFPERRQRQARKAVNRVALQVVVIGMTIVIVSALGVSYLTRDMDWRMTLVLEGISRLEAAWCLSFVSVKTPQWIGVYCSPSSERRIQHVGKGIQVLRFHVACSISQYFAFVFCFMLPFTGKPLSAIIGFMGGLLLETCVHYARKGSGTRQARMAILLGFVFMVASATFFADGCHYIQVVWGSGIWSNEWGLGLLTFFFSIILQTYAHFFQWRRTEQQTLMRSTRKFTVYDREEKQAISLIMSHLFGSRILQKEEMEMIQEEEVADEQEDEDKTDVYPTTTWSLIKTRWSTPSDLIIFSSAEYYITMIVSLVSLFVVIVNIGATAQMNVVRQHFHSVHTTLYGSMEEGPVCAFDSVGGNMTTFESSHAAHEAGYKVAHCGACGACSDWHNLRLQYTTREYLAKESARCARKSLIGGREAVRKCLGEEPICFRGKCAECWTEDIFCARSHCAFIFLQSNMINTVTTFQVGEDTITSATCEEAMCELEFVPCSGANRRRMHITSTIVRPGRQLCGIVDVDWAKVFGEDASYSDIPPAGESEKGEL